MMIKKIQSAANLARLTGVVLALTLAALCFLPLLAHSPRAAEQSFSARRTAYAAGIRKTYDFRFGKDQPFLPSNAQIEGDDFIQPGAFPTAQYCEHCHQDSYHQWRQSAPATSFREHF